MSILLKCYIIFLLHGILHVCLYCSSRPFSILSILLSFAPCICINAHFRLWNVSNGFVWFQEAKKISLVGTTGYRKLLFHFICNHYLYHLEIYVDFCFNHITMHVTDKRLSYRVFFVLFCLILFRVFHMNKTQPSFYTVYIIYAVLNKIWQF